MRRTAILGLTLAAVLAVVPVSLSAQSSAPQQSIEAVVKGLKPQHGRVTLADAKATLDLGSAYDFYGPADARTILVDVWGNPPESAEGVLGLVMQTGTSPLSDAWGAVVTFEETGWVSDEDAATTDYSELLSDMRSGEDESNQRRSEAGYPAIHLVGWAEQPVYDKASHSVVWAQELAFSGSQTNTLNYDVRSLGRSGVLSLNLVSSMPHLSEVKTAAHEFAKHASFDSGATYADFNPDIDKQAEYGIAGLVAAGAGVAVAKKLGILAILLKFLKPILIGIVVLFGAFRNRILGLLRRNKDPLEGYEEKEQ